MGEGKKFKMTNDYIIAVDETGQPFIAHRYDDATRFGRQNKQHKYIARIREGKNWRYFYTYDEYYQYLKDLHKTDSKKFNRLKNDDGRDVQAHPDWYKMDPDSDPRSAWSGKELDRLDRISDGRRSLLKSRYDTARDRYERIRKTKSAKPEDIKRAKKAYEDAREEYETWYG
jgi:hypothetical protein